MDIRRTNMNHQNNKYQLQYILNTRIMFLASIHIPTLPSPASISRSSHHGLWPPFACFDPTLVTTRPATHACSRDRQAVRGEPERCPVIGSGGAPASVITLDRGRVTFPLLLYTYTAHTRRVAATGCEKGSVEGSGRSSVASLGFSSRDFYRRYLVILSCK